MNNILFLKPVFQERIWGGTKLQSWFPAENLGDKIGECWAISAHLNGLSIVEDGPLAGKDLREVYQKYPELFGNPAATNFPLLVKILDASDDLSVQVHPDDEYGLRVEGELGKTECWYVLDCEPDATIIYGHTAQTKETFVQMVEQGKWNDLLVELPVKKGDFFYVPSGTIHALKKGTLILEVQQSSDTTYRLYDYDRKDDAGNLRELHLEKSLEVTTIPHETPSIEQTTTMHDDTTIETLITSEFFTVKKLSILSEFVYTREAPYVLVTISSGTGAVNGIAVKKGSSFIIPTTVETVTFTGQMECILSFE